MLMNKFKLKGNLSLSKNYLFIKYLVLVTYKELFIKCVVY